MNKTEITLPKENKYETIQVLRFICALMVIILHSTFYTSERLDSGTFIYYQGYDGVKLFFVISGFVMIISSESLLEKSNGWSIFAIKRVIRILPIYWIITTYKLLVLIFASSLVFHARLDTLFILKSYFFIPAVNVDGRIQPFYAVGWTLNYEMFFYFLFTVSLLIKVRPLIFLGAILIPLAALSIFKTDSWPSLGFYADPIILNFLYGMIAAKLILSGKRLPEWLAVPLLIITLVYTFLPRHGGIFSNINLPSNEVLSSIAAFFVIFSGASIENFWGKKVPRTLVYLGGASYSLYLIHPSVAPFVPTVLKHFNLKYDLFSVTAGVILAILVGTVFYKYCEKPLTRALSKKAKKLNII